MRILQIVSPAASEFDRKLQRIDAAAMPDVYVDTQATLAHVYGPVAEPPATRYIAAHLPPKRRFAWRQPRQPERLIAPVPAAGHEVVPEAVEERYFAASVIPSAARDLGAGWLDAGAMEPPARTGPSLTVGMTAERRHRVDGRKVAGYFARPSVENVIEQTAARVARNRDDVDFLAFATTPQPEEFDACDVWLDPAIDDSDCDGFVAEAMVRGVSVVAARTAINVHRSERGRTAWLVPPRDSNELTHAILAALFKPEMSEARRSAARQTISKFRPRQRSRALIALYESLTPRP